MQKLKVPLDVMEKNSKNPNNERKKKPANELSVDLPHISYHQSSMHLQDYEI